MKSRTCSNLCIVILVVLAFFQFTALSEEEITIPLSEITALKDDKYPLFSVYELGFGEVTVPKSWVKDESLVGDFTDGLEIRITVPITAVKDEKYGLLTPRQLGNERVTVPASWVASDWPKDYKQTLLDNNKRWVFKIGRFVPPQFTKERVEDHLAYDVHGLRVNADFKIDLAGVRDNLNLNP